MKELKNAVVLLLVLTGLTGFLYPLMTTGLAALLFPHQAAGSPAYAAGSAGGPGRVVGSERIGQLFEGPGHFSGRPSATSKGPYDAWPSGGSNLAPSNPALSRQVAERAAALRARHPGQQRPIPVDLVTSSASGLDPDISLAAARWQAPQVARERGLPEDQVMDLIDSLAQRRVLVFLGEPRVNVLALNLALDALDGSHAGIGR